jgi:hypothetical protein
MPETTAIWFDTIFAAFTSRPCIYCGNYGHAAGNCPSEEALMDYWTEGAGALVNTVVVSFVGTSYSPYLKYEAKANVEVHVPEPVVRAMWDVIEEASRYSICEELGHLKVRLGGDLNPVWPQNQIQRHMLPCEATFYDADSDKVGIELATLGHKPGHGIVLRACLDRETMAELITNWDREAFERQERIFDEEDRRFEAKYGRGKFEEMSPERAAAYED